MVETRMVPLDQLRIPDVRASSKMTPEQMDFFKATVEEFGVIQEPIARPLEDGTYELVAGRQRVLELADKGAREVEMKVIEADAETALFMHLAENVARGDVEPISVARVIEQLMGLEVSIPEIARKLGRSETWVRRTHRLLELPDQYQEAIKEGALTPTHVQLALQMPTAYEVDQALQTALRLGWNTPTLGIFVKNRLEQLARAREISQETGQKVEAPPPDPERMVQYQQCLTCGYQVPRAKIQVQLICDSCRDLIRYVVDQVGPPEEAIKTVYTALVALYKAPVRTPPGPPDPTQDPEQR